MPLVLGVGSDATGSAVEVRDTASGRLVGAGVATHAGAGDGTQHPELWWDAMVDAIDDADVRLEIAGMAVAAQRQALVLLDGAGAPIQPASLRDDRIAAASAAALAAKLGPAKLAQRTGQVLGPETPLARLVTLVADDHGLAPRIAATLGAAELLTLRLTGRFVADRASASGTGWWDPTGGRWRTDLLDRVARPAPSGGWGATLAEVVGAASPADRVSATVHGLVGLRGRPVVAAGTDDLAARALAAAVPPGGVGILTGTDAVVVAVGDEPRIDGSGVVASFADATGRHLPTIAVLAVGPVLEGIARLLGTDAHGLAALADTAVGDPADGPLVVGARPGGPGGRPRRRSGSVLGLASHHSPADLARAALLGVAAELLDAVDALDPEGTAPLVLAGPDASWPGLGEALADLRCGPVLLGPAAAPSTGACLIAAAALDGADPLEVAAVWGVDGGTELEPGGALDGPATRAAFAAMKTIEIT